MISIGGHFKGPELDNSKIKRLLQAAMRALETVRGPWVGSDDFGPCDDKPESGQFFVKGSAPAVNVVFYVPGSLGNEGPDKIEAARFSRKQKLLLVAVPVPAELVESDAAGSFVINSLRQANQIAAETFAKKGMEPFDQEQADAIVDKVELLLSDRRS